MNRHAFPKDSRGQSVKNTVAYPAQLVSRDQVNQIVVETLFLVPSGATPFSCQQVNGNIPIDGDSS